MSNPIPVFVYIKNKFESNDVMVIYNDKVTKGTETIQDYKILRDFYLPIEEVCREVNWRYTTDQDVRGSEASVTILFDLDVFDYEYLTRAKTQLVIVTMTGNYRYFL